MANTVFRFNWQPIYAVDSGLLLNIVKREQPNAQSNVKFVKHNKNAHQVRRIY